MFLECGNNTFSRIDLVAVGRNKVNVFLVGLDVRFHCFEHLLSVTFRVGLQPRAARAARILVKAVIMAASFLEGMACTSIALRSWMYTTNMYCIDLKEQTWNVPGRLVYIVPVLWLARVAKQNMLWVAQISLLGCRLSTSRRA
jgi:hypothetical protein